MILEKGDMWSVFDKRELWLFTGNSYINKAGELVMGRGLALEVKKKYRYMPMKLGRWLAKTYGHLGSYGVLTAVSPFMGVFQVKRHFKAKAELCLIGYSCVVLKEMIDKRGFQRVDMNFPGIGFGRLERKHVLPLISELPDCVHVWER